VKGNLKIIHHDAIEEIKDIHQALKRGRGRPWKVDVNTAEDHQEASSPGLGKGSVPYGGVGCCLGPERNGVSPGEGGEGGQALQTRSKISSQTPARKEATWSRRKKERRARRNKEDPACTE
jgi:hypothetical protein